MESTRCRTNQFYDTNQSTYENSPAAEPNKFYECNSFDNNVSPDFDEVDQIEYNRLTNFFEGEKEKKDESDAKSGVNGQNALSENEGNKEEKREECELSKESETKVLNELNVSECDFTIKASKRVLNKIFVRFLKSVLHCAIKYDAKSDKKGSNLRNEALFIRKFKGFKTFKIRLKNIIYSKTIRENLKELEWKVRDDSETLINLIDKGYFKMTCLSISLKYIDFVAFIYERKKGFECLVKGSWYYDKSVRTDDFNKVIEKSICKFLIKQRNMKCLKSIIG